MPSRSSGTSNKNFVLLSNIISRWFSELKIPLISESRLISRLFYYNFQKLLFCVIFVMRSSAPERVASAVPLSPDIYLPGGRCFILSCRIQEKGYFCKHDNLEYVKYLLNDKVEYVHHRLKTYDQRDIVGIAASQTK